MKRLFRQLGKKSVLAFLYPFCIMLMILIVRGIYPFGDKSFLHMDMYHQYMPFFAEFLHKLKNGESLLYSWNVGMGSNFLALFSYYLASPANWLVVLSPEKYLMEFMTFLIVIKMSLCGVTFYQYLKYHFKEERYSMVLFSCFYALSGFLAAYNWDIMWLDNVILAPLIILGLEKLFYEKKFLVYTLTLGLSILSDYYLSIMICIFVVLYFLVLLFAEPKRWKAIFPFAGSSLLAGGLAGVLLLPTYFALRFSEFGQFAFPKKISTYFPLWDVVARHFMNVVTEQQLDHWPNIYCGVAVFLLLPAYVLNRRIPWRERLGKLALSAFLLLGFSVNMLAFVWHGFNYPDSLPARQSFLYIFLMLLMCYEAFVKLRSVSTKVLWGSLAGTLMYVLLCEKFLGYDGDFTLASFYGTGIFLLLYAGLLCLYHRGNFGNRRIYAGFMVLSTAVVLLESGINMASTSVSVTSRSAYLEDLDAYEKLVARVRERDDGFYRFEKWKRTTKNDGNLVGYPTATVFSSTANSYIGDLYEKWGMGYSKVFYCFDGATPLTSALLNVKYMFSETPREEAGGLYRFVDEEDGIYLYECSLSLPLGFVAPEGFHMPEEKLDRTVTTPFEVQNDMVQELADGERIFIPVSVQDEGAAVRIDILETGYYYAFSRSKKTKNMTVSVDGRETEYKKMGNGYILPIGYVEAGSEVLLTCEENVELNIAACRLEMETLQTVIEKLQSQTFSVEDFSSDYIRGHIQVDTPGELVLSIPYEPGWSILVDGKEVEPDWYAEAFLSVWLEKGEHQITLTYFPQGLKAGIAVSVLSLAVLAVICILQQKDGNTVRKTKKQEDR